MFQRRLDHTVMNMCRRQVNDHPDLRVIEHLFHSNCLYPVLLCFLLCALKMSRAYGLYIQIFKPVDHIFQVNIADRTGTDYTDAYFFLSHTDFLLLPLNHFLFHIVCFHTASVYISPAAITARPFLSSTSSISSAPGMQALRSIPRSWPTQGIRIRRQGCGS